MATYNYTYNGKNYIIELEVGKTIIKLGVNDENGLQEQLRFTRFSSDDEQRLMVINFNREFLSPTGIVVQSIPGQPIRIFNDSAKTLYQPDSNGSLQPVEVPAQPQFDNWDEKLGVPVLRKLFANTLLGAIGVEAYFNPEELV